jgi:hypothetical protein
MAHSFAKLGLFRFQLDADMRMSGSGHFLEYLENQRSETGSQEISLETEGKIEETRKQCYNIAHFEPELTV